MKNIFLKSEGKQTFKQIADLPNSYVVADEEETGFGNRIPMDVRILVLTMQRNGRRLCQNR